MAASAEFTQKRGEIAGSPFFLVCSANQKMGKIAACWLS